MLITMDGVACSGKTTQIELLKEKLGSRDDIAFTSKGKLAFSSQIYNTILTSGMIVHPETEGLLCTADFVEELYHIANLLESGKIVISDQWIDTSKNIENMLKTHAGELYNKTTPDLSICLMLSPKDILERTKCTQDLTLKEINEVHSVYENFYKMMNKIRRRDPNRIKVIDAKRNAKDIHAEILKIIEDACQQKI